MIQSESQSLRSRSHSENSYILRSPKKDNNILSLIENTNKTSTNNTDPTTDFTVTTDLSCPSEQAISNSLSSSSIDSSSKERNLYLREKVIEELVATETDYIRDLKTIVDVYYTPMSEILPMQKIRTIFSNITTLLNFSTEFLQQLTQECKKPMEQQKFGSIFCSYSPLLKAYTQYSSDHQISVELIRTLRKKRPAFESFLEKCQQDTRTQGNTLTSYLIRPIQRICKYPLLLRELTKYQPMNHIDYKNLLSANVKIGEVVADIDERKKRFEDTIKLKKIQEGITGLEGLVQPGRFLVREGELSKMGFRKTMRRRYAYLFNDILIYTELHKKDQFKSGSNSSPTLPGVSSNGTFSKSSPLSPRNHQFMKVMKGRVELANCDPQILDDVQNGFSIHSSKKKRLIFAADSSYERDTWLRDLMMCVSGDIAHDEKRGGISNKRREESSVKTINVTTMRQRSSTAHSSKKDSSHFISPLHLSSILKGSRKIQQDTPQTARAPEKSPTSNHRRLSATTSQSNLLAQPKTITTSLGGISPIHSHNNKISSGDAFIHQHNSYDSSSKRRSSPDSRDSKMNSDIPVMDDRWNALERDRDSSNSTDTTSANTETI